MNLPILAFHTSGVTQYVAFCDWLPSLGMFSKLIHVVACINTLSLFIAKYYSTVWLSHILYIYLSVGGHMGTTTQLNNTFMNMCVQAFVWPHLHSLG